VQESGYSLGAVEESSWGPAEDLTRSHSEQGKGLLQPAEHVPVRMRVWVCKTSNRGRVGSTMSIEGTVLHTPFPIVAACRPRAPGAVSPSSRSILFPPSTTPRRECWLSN